MLSCPDRVNKTIPAEYRKTAEALFPPKGGVGGSEQALAFADILEVSADYRKLLSLGELRPVGSPPNAEMRKFLHSFQNNLDLLIQKTWVEKTDEDRKEKLQNRIPGFVTHIENADYAEALKEFSVVLEELSWLLFGPQSHKEDFIEYVFRIDSQLGLFWWYVGQTSRVLAELTDRAVIRSILFLGICYLTDF
jgi:ribosomal protein S17E